MSQPRSREAHCERVPESVGDTGSVSLSYVNKGKNPVSNLEARLTGTNLGAGGYQYLGNLAAGTEGSVDFDIVPDAAGTVSGIITLNYEDASGNPQTISKDFSVSAEEMNMDDFNYDPSMDDVQPEQTGMPVWAWVLIGVCGAVVVIVVIVGACPCTEMVASGLVRRRSKTICFFTASIIWPLNRKLAIISLAWPSTIASLLVFCTIMVRLMWSE